MILCELRGIGKLSGVVNMNNEPIEIPLGKKKILIVLMGGIALVTFGFFIALRPELFVSRLFGITNPQVYVVFGIIAVLFFGAACTLGIKKLFDKTTGLIINSKGIVDNTNASSIGLIEWSDIIEIRKAQVQSTKFLLLIVRNPEVYIQKAKNGLQAKMMRMNMKIYETPITIVSGTLKIKFEELEQMVIENYLRNKT